MTKTLFFPVTEELQSLRESETRLKQQYAESQRRERILVRRLAVKEQEIQDYAVNIALHFCEEKKIWFVPLSMLI